MPLISYLCQCGKKQSKFYRMSKDATSYRPCECGLDAKRQLSSPSNASIITVDNGVQSKAVEVNLEVIKSIEQNSTKDFSKD